MCFLFVLFVCFFHLDLGFMEGEIEMLVKLFC